MAFLESSAIPDHIARLISPDDRKKIGKGAMTLVEAIGKAEDRLEKELQEQIRTLLEVHRGIVVIYSRMDRKATTPPGTPDFIFAVVGSPTNRTDAQVFPVAWEIKTPTGKQSAEQIEMERRMTIPPNAWRYKIIRSVQEARDELRSIGLE